MASPKLGQRLSLISKSNIRYEGLLYAIDPEQNTVSLKNVRMFGTENRPTATPIQASDDVYRFIVFKGSDIKDLTVFNDPKDAPPPDPAIVSAGKALTAEERRAEERAAAQAGAAGGRAPPRGGGGGMYDTFGAADDGGRGAPRRGDAPPRRGYDDAPRNYDRDYGYERYGRGWDDRGARGYERGGYDEGYGRHGGGGGAGGGASRGNYGGYGDAPVRTGGGGGGGGGGRDWQRDDRRGGDRGYGQVARYGRGGGGGGRPSARRQGRGGGGDHGGRQRRGRSDAYASHTGMEFAKEKADGDAAQGAGGETFDFAAMQDKIKEIEKPEGDKGGGEGTKYEKGSFFDSLTYDDKQDRGGQSRGPQHQTDCETFGSRTVEEYERRTQGGRKGGKGGGGGGGKGGGGGGKGGRHR
eukprot:TRINITY_DN1967_c0_g1_i1.p2 TRINITY_DN1967_c0_g1~~TRINITY_DN1967_c0_g1_i1.p2  ORF type:complete len:411 (+),score=86.13 TRINITY_DN1967_c0_g1_i1:120-1352(+)